MPPHKPIHLRPTAELAERVLLPGDPGRALALAQLLTEGPLMFNHHRGLWGYTGPAKADGEPLTIQSTGMGGPSAAIVLQELITLGVRRAIRVGTCGALDGSLALGDLLVAHEALAADGTSRALGAGERISADQALTEALADAAVNANGAESQTGKPVDSAHPLGDEPDAGTAVRVADGEEQPRAEMHTHREATIVSTDLFYEPHPERERDWRAAGAVAVEMEAATLFAVGARAGIPVACVLTVSNVLSDHPEDPQENIDDDALLAAAEAMGRLALSALV
jgi:uridine phosphorylase